MRNVWRVFSIMALLVAVSACETGYTGLHATALGNCAPDAQQRVQATDWSGMETIDIKAGEVLFSTSQIYLKPQHPYLFRIANEDTSGHYFQAREFFHAAAIKEVVKNNRYRKPCINSVWLAPQEKIEVQLVTGEPGKYEFVDGNFLVEYITAGNAAGIIVVE
jgi:hypothetical protein